MGSAWYRAREGREQALGQILNDNYKYLVALVGVNNETRKRARGACTVQRIKRKSHKTICNCDSKRK